MLSLWSKTYNLRTQDQFDIGIILLDLPHIHLSIILNEKEEQLGRLVANYLGLGSNLGLQICS